MQTPVGLQLKHMTMLMERKARMSNHEKNAEHEAIRLLREAGERLKQTNKNLEDIMSVLSDLQNAVAGVQAAVATETSAVQAAISDINSLPASDAQLVPLTTALTNAATQTNANAAALTAAVGGGTVVTPPTGTAPVITSQPGSFTGSVGAGTTTTTLSVATSDAPGTDAFQWFTGDPTVATPAPVAIPGATGATFTTPIQTAPSTVSYFVAVTNATGTTNSAAVVVTITA
jgi:hypothetical protein